MLKKALFMILCLGLLLGAACAPGKAVKKEAPLAAAGEEELILPEPPSKKPSEVKPAAKPEQMWIEKVDEEQYIVLNFENAELDTVIATFGELLNINYLLSPGLSGKVTIQSYKKFPMKDLFRIFQSILEINGLTAVEDGSLYRIVPIDTARMQPLEVERGRETKLVLNAGFITQLVPLEYVNVTEIANILRQLAPRGTDIIIYEPANILIITALPQSLAKFMKVIEAIDVSETERETMRTFVYHVENGEAKKLEGIIKSIYPEKKEAARPAQTQPTTGQLRRTTAPVAQSPEALPAEIGEIAVTAYEDINALIIKATPKTYLALLELLKKIDVQAKQVLIEVLVAEVTLTDKSRFGVDWLFRNVNTVKNLNLEGGLTPITTTGPVAPVRQAPLSGLITGTINSAELTAAINVLASETKLNVLASPHILAMDNKEAKIEIGDERPVATGQVVQQPSGSTAGEFQVSSQIQYKTVGKILTVTPHITEKGRVNLKVLVEVSQVSPTQATVGSSQFDAFSTRKVSTHAVVDSERTLLIGGLLSEDKTHTRTGIPFLSKIPLLGYLFSNTEDTQIKTELVIMVTPRVISNQEDADELMAQFKERIKLIRSDLNRIQKKEKKKDEKDKSDETAPSP